jgi:hypothetical protein
MRARTNRIDAGNHFQGNEIAILRPEVLNQGSCGLILSTPMARKTSDLLIFYGGLEHIFGLFRFSEILELVLALLTRTCDLSSTGVACRKQCSSAI